jgi:hypothetical protein
MKRSFGLSEILLVEVAMRKSRSLCYAASVVAAAVFLVGPSTAFREPQAPVDGADPNGYVIAQHPYSPVYEAPPEVIAGSAMVEAFDTVGSDGMPGRHVQMTWQSNEDVG